MKKIKKRTSHFHRVFAAVLAAALLFTMPGMVSYAEAEDAQTEDISGSVTAQAEDDAAEETGAETEAMQESEAEESDTDQPEALEDDTKDTETDDKEPAEEENVPAQKEDAGETDITLTGWKCADYPEDGAYEGAYTFTASLPEGYALAEDADALKVKAELGEAKMLAGEVSADYQEASWSSGEVTYTTKTAENCTSVENSTEAVTWDEGWYVVTGTVTIEKPITVNGAVNLILADGCELNSEQGIVVTSGNSLTIYAQNGGSGTLNATGVADNSSANAGIGGSAENPTSGEVTIHGGVIHATGGGMAGYCGTAGIGGGTPSSGNGGNSGTITIYGGTVTANSGQGNTTGAGIGGGVGRSTDAGGACTGITIYGGTVNATGGRLGAGIGGGASEGGNGGAGSNIEIYGGSVNAIGGNMGAGIGGGCGGGTCGNGTGITISGGKVTAVGGKYAAGIGGGGGYIFSSTIIGGGAGTGISITGGIVDAKGGEPNSSGDYAGDPIGNGGNASGDADVTRLAGIIFENGEGKVYGTVELNENYDIPAGYTLNFADGGQFDGNYAFYKDGSPVEMAVVKASGVTGPATVQACTHPGVNASSNDDGTHTLNCPYCDYTGTAKDCSYGTAQQHDETRHTRTCTVCGYENLEAHKFASSSGTENGSIIFNKECLQCQYMGNVGTALLTIPSNLVYGQTAGKTISVEPKFSYDSVTMELDWDGNIVNNTSIDLPAVMSVGKHFVGIIIVAEGIKNESYVAFTVGKAPLTITASDQTITYGGSITQGTGNVTAAGLCNGDSLNSITLIASTANVPGGKITPSAAGMKNSSGKDVTGNYEITYKEGSLTINKADAEITVGTDTYNKTFGDATFTLDVTDNNTEADVQYKVTGATDVVSVSDGTVDILNAGTAAITVSLPESTNYNAAEDKTITVNVAKKDGYMANEINNSYYFDKQDTAKINLAVLLPADCGTVSYGTPEVAGDVTYSAEPIVNDGELSYTVDKGSVDEKGTITVVVTTRNYADIMVTVSITRSSCDHAAGEEIFYTGEGEKAPTCTEDGIGHRECTKCGTIMEAGVVAPALGHDYKDEVTKEPTVSEEGERTFTCVRCGDAYTESIPRTTPEGLWVSGLEPSYSYTGSAVKPEGIRVYHGTTLLCEKTEYTISYKNNTKAGTAQVIVTGKGSYKGKATAAFTIEPVHLETDDGISATVATVTETGKILKPTVNVAWNGKKLKQNTDYTLSYEANIKTASAEGYDVAINGRGNYTGTLLRKFHVAPRGTPLLNSAKVTGLAKSYSYDQSSQNDRQNEQDEDLEGRDAISGKLESDLAKISVKVGTATLTKDVDYVVRTEGTDAVGTGYVVIEPAQTSAYTGEKRIPVKITGTNVKKCYITGLQKTYPYTGQSVMPEIKVYTGKNGTGTQIPSDAYTVRYSNCINQGKATVTVMGIPGKGCSGSIKATYTIGRLNLATQESAGTITVTMPTDTKYAKGGAKPQPVITQKDKGILREGVDYTVKYSNNAATYGNGSSAGKKSPALKITGIGNYSGTVTKNFAIGAQDIGTLEITAADKAYNSKKKGSYYYAAPKVYDLNGKQLQSGKDYTASYTNVATGREIGKNDTVENGAQIRVTVTGKGSYTGNLGTTYHVCDAKDVKDLAKAKYDKIPSAQYTGSEIKPEIRLYTLTGRTKNYLTEDDYEVIGYYNNVKKGTATILVRGKNAYSGVKSITFKITAADNQSIWSGIF